MSQSHLERARQGSESVDWPLAAQAYEGARRDGEDLSAVDFESWAVALYMLGKVSEAVDPLSQAFHSLLGSGDLEEASRVGHWIVFMLLESGEIARAGGWIARCERLLDNAPDDSFARTYLLLLETHRNAAVEGDYATAVSKARLVVSSAREHGDHDVEALALSLLGRSIVRDGRAGEGLVVLDEAMVAITSTALSPIVVGTVYCSVIEACEEIAELRRASEWTEALFRWCETHRGEVPFTAQCRIHRSKIFQRAGRLADAEDEALRAYELFTQTPYRAATGRAIYQLAEVQRVRGNFSDAETLYEEASEWGVDPQPGLAMVRLALGDSDAAVAGLKRLIAETNEPTDRLALLPTYAEAMLAAGEIDSAREAASELEAHLELFDNDAIRATLSHIRGAVALVEGNWERCLIHLREAREAWQGLGARYEAARSGVLIAHACRALGDEETARLEHAAASRTFAEFGVAQVPELFSATGPDHDLTARERDVLGILATGATNREIADELFISVRTVDRHVANILTKLGVPSRTAAVSFAYEHELV